MRVGVVVLTYQCGKAVGPTLRSLTTSSRPADLVLVVDNGSGDDTVEAVRSLAPGIEVLPRATNAGYAAAVNEGARLLLDRGADVVVCLTHDAVLDSDCLGALESAMEDDPRLGAAGPVLQRVSDRTPWSAGGVVAGWRRVPRHLHDQPAASRPVEWLDGAVLAVRGDAFRDVGGFREDLFLYWEDVDLCLRLREHSWGVAVVGPARAAQEPSGTPPYLMARNKWLVMSRRAPSLFLLADAVGTAGRDLLGRRRTTAGRRVAAVRLRGLRDGMTGRLDHRVALDRDRSADGPTRDQAGSLVVVNPLPGTLHHYTRQLFDVLAEAGVPAVLGRSPSIEVAGAWWRRSWVTGRLLVHRRLRSGHGHVLALWPVFGRLDGLSWPRRRAVSVVVHDPEPLRRQLGMGAVATALGRRAASRRAPALVHGAPAAEALVSLGWPPPDVVPHPFSAPARWRDPVPVQHRSGLVVLGQWKPARSIAPLAQLAADATWDGRRSVLGRGWPDVEGWDVDARFLREDEVDKALGTALCLVLPYDRYFQSGVAVRALELMTPVVGRRHPFLEELYGDDWPGLVVDEDWSSAARRASAVSTDELSRLRERAWRHSVAGWRAWAEARLDPSVTRRG